MKRPRDVPRKYGKGGATPTLIGHGAAADQPPVWFHTSNVAQVWRTPRPSLVLLISCQPAQSHLPIVVIVGVSLGRKQEGSSDVLLL